MVAKSSRSVRKLCTGIPSGVRLSAALRRAEGEGFAGDDDGSARGVRSGRVVLVEQDGGEPLAHVPFDVVGEHAQQHVSAHALGEVVVDGPHLEIDGLDAVEGALDPAQSLVGAHRVLGSELSLGQAGWCR